MKLYIQDHGWAGVLVAVADSEQEARAMFEGHYNYNSEQALEEKEITKGIVVENLGDS